MTFNMSYSGGFLVKEKYSDIIFRIPLTQSMLLIFPSATEKRRKRLTQRDREKELYSDECAKSYHSWVNLSRESI